MFAGAVITLTKAVHRWKNPSDGENPDAEENVCVILFVAMPIAMLIGGIVGILELIEAIRILLNPAYWAYTHLF